MTADQWIVVAALSAAALAIRLAGVAGGAAIARNERLSRLLGDMPGGLLAGLVGSALAFGGWAEWGAAAVALAAAGRLGVVGAMAAGMGAVVALRALGL